MKGLWGCEYGFGGPWLIWSTEKVRVRESGWGAVEDGGKNGRCADAGAEGAWAGYGNGGSGPRASCIDGRDWRAGSLCSLSFSDVRRDSGGESKPPEGPGSELADDDW
jgi:hypothetical protein